MAMPWEKYQQVIVETYRADKQGKSSKIHVRPIVGQPFPTTMDVQWSRKLREAHPVGTKFRLRAKLSNREGGEEFLQSWYSWPYEVVV